MKSGKSSVLSAALALVAICSASAQSVSYILVSKEVERTQIAAPGMGATTQSATPFTFNVRVGGTGLSAPEVTLAGGSTYAGSNTLVLNSEGEWGYGPSGFGVQTNNTNLDTYFALGDHTVTVPDVGAVTLALSGVSTGMSGQLPNQPILTMTGGVWSGGKYFINVTQPLTVTTSIFNAYLTGGIGGHMALGLWEGEDDLVDLEVFSRIGPDGATFDEVNNTLSFTIPANTLVAGTDYFGEAIFSRLVDQDVGVPDALALSYYEATTNFTISAVPEPSTYAALAGLVVLGIAYWRRRAAGVVAG